MKLILAVIRISKMNETKKALALAGLPSFTAMSVLGRGKSLGNTAFYHEGVQSPVTKELLEDAAGPLPRLKAKRMITLVVTDTKKQLAIETIINVNQTGNSGDGKIYVLEALDSFSVRTGVQGDLTLD